MGLHVEGTINIGLSLTYPHGVGVTDIDGNGKPELTVIRFSVPGGVLLDLAVLELQANGTVQNRVDDLVLSKAPQTDFGRDILVQDVNGDGEKDIIIADHGLDADPFPGARNLVLLSDGKGHLLNRSSSFSTEADFTHSLAAGDFDGNGRAEILFNNFGVDAPYMMTVSAKGTGIPFRVSLPFLGNYTTATEKTNWSLASATRATLLSTAPLSILKTTPGSCATCQTQRAKAASFRWTASWRI